MTAAVYTQAPCAKCPFRKDVPNYLRRARRAEIAAALLRGGGFPCHATINYDEDDELDTNGGMECAGAAKTLLAAGTSNNLMRVMSRLGAFDPDRAEQRGAAVWDLTEWQAIPEGATGDNPGGDDHEPEPEVRTCSVVNPGCLAPAGYAISGGIAYGTEDADGECTMCGEPLCSNCADDEGLCSMCGDEDDGET